MIVNYPESGSENSFLHELISKRFSLVKLKADRKFQPQEYLGISRIEISDQRRDWPKWGVLELAHQDIIQEE